MSRYSRFTYKVQWLDVAVLVKPVLREDFDSFYRHKCGFQFVLEVDECERMWQFFHSHLKLEMGICPGSKNTRLLIHAALHYCPACLKIKIKTADGTIMSQKPISGKMPINHSHLKTVED